MGRAAVVLGLSLCCLPPLAGCDDLLEPPQQGFGCSSDFETCNGANDCFATCMCNSGDDQRCAAQCDRGDAARVSDLDERDWPTQFASFGDEVLALTNQARATGGCCGNRGCFDPSGPLRLEPLLQTAARAHAKDMAERDYFDHDTPEGLDPFDRMREAGYRGCAMGENIAAGQTDPAEVVSGWLESPGHCSNILSPEFDALGVGYFEGMGGELQRFWVQNFGG